MSKTDLVTYVAEKAELTKADASRAVEEFLTKNRNNQKTFGFPLDKWL